MAKQTPAPKKPEQKKDSVVADNIKFTLSIPWATVQEVYKKVLTAAAKDAELSGFRKGKAPEKLVEEKIGKEKLYNETAYTVLSPAYAHAIEEKKLKPITDPLVKTLSTEEGKDWEFEIEVAEAPDVQLGDYKDIVKTAKTKNAIWVPGKSEKPTEGQSEDEKLKNIFSALLEHIHVKIPALLLRSETNHELSHMVEQLDKLHVTLDSYLASIHKTADQLRQEYAMQALATLQLEFILNAIAKDTALDVTDKEVTDVFTQAQKTSGAKPAEPTEEQKLRVSISLLKKKTLDYLLSL